MANPTGPKASEIIYDALPSGSAQFERFAEGDHWQHIDSHEAVVHAVDAWLEGER